MTNPPLLFPDPLATSTLLPPTAMHPHPLQHQSHLLWLQMNHLACNAAQIMHSVIWAPISFSLSLLSFIILANFSALFFYSDNVTMTMKRALPAHPCTSKDKQ